MPDTTLYERDFYAWTVAQSGALRRLAAERPDLGADVDWERVAEELEAMGDEQAHAVESALVRIIEHLLKLEHSPASDPRNGWRRSVRNARTEVALRLRRNPALAGAHALEEALAAAWPHGRRLAVAAMRDRGGVAAAAAVPDACPYPIALVTDFDAWPEAAGPA